MRKVNKDKLSRLESVEFFGELFATWGAALQVAFIFSWIVIPFLEGITYGAATARSLAVTVEAFRGMSILRFLPVSVLLLGLLIMVSFRFQIDPYRPKTMNEVLPVKKGSLLVSLLIALRIPVWILIVIIGFINHFSKLLWESTRDFFKNFLARLCFIFVGLVLAPALLYFGHIILLKSLHLVTQYLDSETFGFFGNIKQFFIVNLLVLITLCVYVISVPPLAVRYRGETINDFFRSVYSEIRIRGAVSALTVGQTFSLFGIIAFAIPVTSLLPGGPTFGIFSTLYSVIVLTCLGFYVFAKKKEELSTSTGS